MSGNTPDDHHKVDETAVSFARLLNERRSIRGFLDKPVPQHILDHVFALAQRAPSNCNVQPWAVHVVSGEAADRMRTALYRVADEGREEVLDYPLAHVFPDQYRERQIAAAKALFAATGVAREDKVARKHSFLRNFRFFDAPHAAFILMPPWASYREAVDCGIYTQTLMLAMTANGLASCAQGALGHYCDVVRQELGVDDGHRVLFGIAFGYEDRDHPANRAVTERASLDAAVRFHA